MVNLIKTVKISQKNPALGESIRVRVQVSDPAADVSMNNVYGANQYLQMVCQMTPEVQWRYVPGRVLNAKKGDCLLDPGGPRLVGQLLRQVTPAQL